MAKLSDAQVEALMQQVAALQAKLDAKEAARGTITLKVSKARAPKTNGPEDKGTKGGGLSVYGIRRFPHTWYKDEWLRFLDYIGAPEDSVIRQFIRDHDKELTSKE